MSTNPEPPNHGPLGLPAISGMGRTEEQHWKWVLRRLGGGIVDVALTSKGDVDPLTERPFAEGETHMDDCLDETRRWFANRVGMRKMIQVQMQNGQGAYLMPPETIDVINFTLPSFQLPSLDADQFSYTYFSLMFGQWTNPNSAPLPYSDLEQRLMYLKDIGKIFSTDRDWAYDAFTRTLEILPAPGSIGTGAPGSVGGFGLATIWSWHVDCRVLDPQDDGFFRRYLLIQAMKTLGNIRSTVDSWMMQGGDKALNGETLMSNAEGLEEKLNADVLNWKRALPVLLL
jgi:hypothetical protein